jgi:hypothetical protein
MKGIEERAADPVQVLHNPVRKRNIVGPREQQSVPWRPWILVGNKQIMLRVQHVANAPNGSRSHFAISFR